MTCGHALGKQNRPERDGGIAITGNNTGTLGTATFSGIENIDAGAGDDTFSFNDGALVTGILTGGDGIDQANYSNYTTSITVDLQTNSATGTGGINTLESFIGSKNDDTFILSETYPVRSIQGGQGNDTLQGDNVASVWNLTAVNEGDSNGITNFSNIENLTAGNQTDQINFLTNGARFTGELNGDDGPLILRGDSIGMGTRITGTDELRFEPISIDRDINLGGPGLTPALDISTAELAVIDNSFTEIIIGQLEGTGTIMLDADITLPVATTIQSPKGNGSIDTQGFNLEAPELLLSAAQEIITADLTAPDGVKLDSDGSITAQTILTRDDIQGGNVVIDAGTTITTQRIDTTGVNGTGGNVSLTAPETIQVESIRAEGDTAGGYVTIATDQFVRIIGSFSSLDGTTASISTAEHQALIKFFCIDCPQVFEINSHHWINARYTLNLHIFIGTWRLN
ncbi:MAG: hypothetical protein F6K11_37220, partial [Leptolyngbya sp. SIO3F4]|nr:hypothetical protein [Leptolyngbya sp. SIO3F4]